MKIFVTIAIVLLLLTGCSRTVRVNALQPAKIDRAAYTKVIAVHKFHNDRVGLSSKIETSLASKRINRKNYFTMISRSDINRIFKEQRLQSSGLLDESSAVELGNLLGAQALITGEVTNADAIDNNYRAKRTKCVDKKCTSIREYTVACTRRVFSLSAQVKMVDIEKGDIIFSDVLQAKKEWSTCSDRSSALPSEGDGLNQLSQKVASQFTSNLTPSYITMYIELIEDLDFSATDEQEKLLKNSLVYIDHKRFEKSERLLTRLMDETQERSYVVAYDLGVLKEIQGKLGEAKDLYMLADELTTSPNENIDKAINRIQRSIHNAQVAQSQLKR